MDELQVEVTHTVDEDYAVFEFSLPNAAVRVKMATGTEGAQDATLLVHNLANMLMQTIERVNTED